mgnify:CR=1 FL=1
MDKYKQKKDDEDMLAKKETSYKTAKTSDVIKAVVKSNKKHSKMMKKLAK